MLVIVITVCCHCTLSSSMIKCFEQIETIFWRICSCSVVPETRFFHFNAPMWHAGKSHINGKRKMCTIQSEIWYLFDKIRVKGQIVTVFAMHYHLSFLETFKNIVSWKIFFFSINTKLVSRFVKILKSVWRFVTSFCWQIYEIMGLVNTDCLFKLFLQYAWYICISLHLNVSEFS